MGVTARMVKAVSALLHHQRLIGKYFLYSTLRCSYLELRNVVSLSTTVHTDLFASHEGKITTFYPKEGT